MHKATVQIVQIRPLYRGSSTKNIFVWQYIKNNKRFTVEENYNFFELLRENNLLFVFCMYSKSIAFFQRPRIMLDTPSLINFIWLHIFKFQHIARPATNLEPGCNNENILIAQKYAYKH